MFAPQTAALAERYRTIAYTSRAGTSRYGTERCLDDLVDDCLAVVDEAGVDRFVLVGMSVGGFMAVELALRHPGRIAGLVLMATQADAYTAEEAPDPTAGCSVPSTPRGRSPNRSSRPSVR